MARIMLLIRPHLARTLRGADVDVSDHIKALRGAVNATGAPSSDFDLNPDLRPKNRTLRAAAVLVAFCERNGRLELILTKRSSALKHHPGQIAFPGGKVDEGDDGAIGAALREAQEEIGLEPSNVDVLCTLPTHETVTSFEVTPVLALVKKPFEPRPEAGEVEEVFFVPFDHIANPQRYLIEGRYFRGVLRRFYVVPFGPYYIWGATARMLRMLADRLS